jgi:phosphoglycolate phosphatase-like HAD superfamily hydrolase
VDLLDAQFAVGILERVGIHWRPPDAVAFSRDLEFQAMSTINARFPDARAAVERLRHAGHQVYVVTQATESNARGALTGAHLLNLLEGLFTGTSQDSSKSRRGYWARIRFNLPPPQTPCVLVVDRMDHLAAAAAEGFVRLLLDREGVYEAEALSPPRPS